MDRDSNDSDSHSPSSLNKSDTEKSFVGKFKSHVSGIINNTPLSKWFRKNDEKPSRRRDEEHDEELYQMQPPLKRAKLPSANESVTFTNHFSGNSSSTPLGSTSVSRGTFTNFSEPVAGPSGIKSRKLLTSSTISTATSTRHSFSASQLLNGHKDSDSEESTSGYSSVARISSKEQVFESRESSKQTSPLESSPSKSRNIYNKNMNNMSRSLFADSSLSPGMNTSVSSRRPSFNASAFASPHFVDKTLSTKRILNSPFYNGRTTYGGASAYGRRLARTANEPSRLLAKNTVQIKPVNKVNESHVALGKTAQRILNTLEQYSSPVNDAKKIPMMNKRLRSEGGILTKYTGANPYMVRDSKASARELQVPTVSDLLKMKQGKERLQESTETVRQLAASSKSALNVESYKISTKDSEKQQHTGKMKNKITNVRQKAPQTEETVEEIPLVSVPLPITTLPKIDFKMAPPSPQVPAKSSPKTLEKETTAKPSVANFGAQKTASKLIFSAPETESKSPKEQYVEFKFSKPHVIAENIKALVGINNYKFTEPISKKSKLDAVSPQFNFKMPDNKPFVPQVKSTNNGDFNIKPAQQLKTGSVMDVLGRKDQSPKLNSSTVTQSESLLNKFKKPEGSWECSACLIRNQPDKEKCVACETPKEGAKAKTASTGFGSMFNTTNKWECDACLVKNNETDKACVACTTPRPAPTSTSNTSLADKFKPTSDTWECDSCLIRNKKDATKCIACETPKPGAKVPPPTTSTFGLSGMFNKPMGTWECSSCLIQNKSSLNKCAACEASKPGAAPAIPNQFGDKFKKKDTEWECEVCMVKNNSSLTKCQCCETPNPKSVSSAPVPAAAQSKPISSFNFGIDKSVSQQFSFGIPPAAKPDTSSSGPSLASSVFGEAAKAATTSPAAFSFGVPAPASNKIIEEPAKTSEKPSVVAPTAEKAAEPSEPPAKKPEPTSTTPAFSFGTPKKSDVPTTEAKPTFDFKPAAVNGDLNKSGSSLFGAKSADSPKPATFGNLSSTAPATSTTGGFNFGASKPATEPSTTPASASQPEAAPKPALFQFGSGASAQPASNTSSLFGASPKTNGFGTPSSTSFNSSSTSNFGATPSFAANSKTFASNSKPFAFGGSGATTGDNNSDSSKTAPLFSFGQSAPAPAAAQPPTPASGGFNFGQPATPAPGTFSFGAAAKNDATAAPVFGASTAVKNGTTFNFGSNANNNNQKAGFSFGAANNAPPAAPAAAPVFGGFNFNAAPAVPAQGSFNFSGAAATPNTFSFKAEEQQPPVNIFSVPPQNGPRKIKKALRRAQR